MVRTIEAPFTDEQMQALQAYQDNPYVHDYCCPERHPLQVTRDALVCKNCHYHQVWAYEIDIESDPTGQ
jgi:hypothetical protein